MTKYLKTKYVIENVSEDAFELLPVNDLLIIRSTEPDRVDLFTQPSGFSITYKGKSPTSLPGQANEQGLVEEESLGDMLIDACASAMGSNWREVVTIPESYNNAITSALDSGGNWAYPGIPEEGDEAFVKSAAGQAAKLQAEEEIALLVAKKEAAEAQGA